MTGLEAQAARHPAPAGQSRIVRRAAGADPDPGRAMEEIAAALAEERPGGAGDLAFVLLFVSARHDLAAVGAAIARCLPAGLPVIGATTAGEIGPEGYQDGSIVALGFPASHFSCSTRLIRPLSAYALDAGPAIAAELISPEGAGAGARLPHGFVLMLVDGLSCREEALVASIAPALGPVPLVGGSSGDGLDFKTTFVLHEGRFHRDAAVLAHVRSRCPIRTLRLDHFTPTETRMVVTGADPADRRVTEINAEPAAAEYARLLGLGPEQLSPFVFAENPVVVKVSGRHHVRAIQQVEPDGSLRFYSAIDEGLVLTLARPEEIVGHLDRTLGGLDLPSGAAPETIIGFDCVLRRLEVEQRQTRTRMSEVLRRHRVTGFNTYGEQYGAMHVSQTMTGVAIYPAPPGPEAPAE